MVPPTDRGPHDGEDRLDGDVQGPGSRDRGLHDGEDRLDGDVDHSGRSTGAARLAVSHQLCGGHGTHPRLTQQGIHI